VKDNS